MKNVLILGRGKSGIGVSNLLNGLGIKHDFYDEAKSSNIDDDIKIYDKSISDDILRLYDTVIISPGISIHSTIANRIKKLDIDIIGEVELAYRNIKSDIIAITGTNGKTTTTTLVGDIISKKYNVAVVGNIGNSITDEISKNKLRDVYVTEISSFQLESICKFRAKITAVLNITPDHLDRHNNIKEYEKVKFEITKNQTEEDYVVLNYDDQTVRNHKIVSNVSKVYFSLEEKVYGAYVSAGAIFFNDEKIIELSEIKILGKHNISNILAAVAITKLYGIDSETIRKTISEFMGVEHRIEYVDTINGVKYYNDSKGTNPDAAIYAIKAMPSKTILIAGGYDKGANYDEWLGAAKDKVKYLILMGDTALKIQASAKSIGYKNIIMVDSMKMALDKSYELAQGGENVLLSPACASWDMYSNYEIRGKDFKDNVSRLKLYGN